MTDIVAFTGFKGSGKDTAAIAARQLGSYDKVAFADPLRQVCKIVFGLTDEEMTDPVLKEKTLSRWPWESPRQILQKVGTELFRTAYPGVWIRAFEREAAKRSRVVVTDLRFPDEEASLKKAGATIIRVRRPDLESADTHASESHIENMEPDLELTNDFSTPEAWCAYVASVLKRENLI